MMNFFRLCYEGQSADTPAPEVKPLENEGPSGGRVLGVGLQVQEGADHGADLGPIECEATGGPDAE